MLLKVQTSWAKRNQLEEAWVKVLEEEDKCEQNIVIQNFLYDDLKT